MKKTLSILLSVIMIFSLIAPCALASAEYYSDTPIIVVHGMGNKVVGRDGQLDYNGADKIADALLNEEFLKELSEELALAYITDDWNDYADLLYDTAVPCFANTQLEDNGESYETANGQTYNWSWTPASVPGKTSKYTTGRYNYYIDWRLDPMATAEDLSDYIDTVLSKTGASSVKLFVRCMGSNVVFSYLAQEESAYSKISDICFYIPALQGIELVGAAFSGQVELDSTSTDRFANHLLHGTALDADMKALATSLITVLDYIEILGLTTDEINHIIDEVRYILIPRFVMNSFGTYPGFWSLVGEEYFDDAMNFVFKSDEYKEKYAGLIEKITKYDTLVRDNIDNIFAKAEEAGINISAIGKYNSPAIPVFEGCEITSDTFATVGNLSFGATGSVCFKPFSNSYLKEIKGTEREKYLSPDKMVDASTCRYPDTTWFIKDCSHGISPENLYTLGNFILSSNVSSDRVTVFTDTENWAQFLGYDEENEMMIPYEDDLTTNGEKWSSSPFEALIRFLTQIFNFFSKLLKGELDFSNISLFD